VNCCGLRLSFDPSHVPARRGVCTLYVGERPQSDRYVCVLPEKELKLWAAGLRQWPPRLWSWQRRDYDSGMVVEYPMFEYLNPNLDRKEAWQVLEEARQAYGGFQSACQALSYGSLIEVIGVGGTDWKDLGDLLKRYLAPIVATLVLKERNSTMERLNYFTDPKGCGMLIAGWFNNRNTGNRIAVLVK